MHSVFSYLAAAVGLAAAATFVTGVPRPQYPAATSPCTALFTNPTQPLTFKHTGTSDYLSYAAASPGTTVPEYPPNGNLPLKQPVFVTSTTPQTCTQWTVTACTATNTVRLSNPADGLWLAVCPGKSLPTGSASGFYAQMNAQADATDDRSVWKWTDISAPGDTVCKVTLTNAKVGKVLSVCPTGQCKQTTGQYSLCPAVVGADSNYCFEVSTGGAAAPVTNPYNTNTVATNPYNTNTATTNPYNTNTATTNPYNTNTATTNPYAG